MSYEKRLGLGLVAWLVVFVSGLLLLPSSSPAQATIESLEHELQELLGEERLPVLTRLTTAARRSHSEKAVQWGAEALELLARSPDPDIELEVRTSLCYAWERLGKAAEALRHGERALELTITIDDLPARAFIYRILGDAYRHSHSYSLAVVASRRAVAIYEELGQTARAAAAWNEVGIAHRLNDDYTQALQAYFEARALYAEVDDRKGLARVANNLGILYREMGNHAQSLAAYQEALATQRSLGQRAAESRTLNNLGALLQRSGQVEEAIKSYRHSLAIKEVLGDRRGIAHTLGNLGLSYADLEDWSQAERHYRRSLELKKALDDPRGQATTLVHLSQLQQRRGEPRLARRNLEQALELARPLEDKDQLQEIYLELSEVEAATGNPDAALEAFREHARIAAEIAATSLRLSISQLQTLYDSERRERELVRLEQAQRVQDLELARRRSEKNALAVIVVLLFALTGVVYNRFRLESRSARLVAETNQALGQSLEQLEDRNTEMERFIYTVSHDLKSPMLTIRGYVSFLERALDSQDLERVRADLSRIDSASKTMAALLDDLLEISRVGRVPVEPENLALDDIVEEIVVALAGRIDERKAVVEVAEGMPEVVADRQRLMEILLNLIENAVKYGPDRQPPRIHISAERREDRVVLRVRDNGIGIDPAHHEEIFGLFNQLDPKREGTGVGLALVRRIVETQGGRIWLESEPGIGSTFFVELPAAESAAD